MTLRYLRSDADVTVGRRLPTVLAREAGDSLHTALRAATRTYGLSRLGAPYWLARRFGGLLTTPLDTETVIRQTWRVAGGHRVDIALRANQSDLTVLREVFAHRCYDLPAEHAGPMHTIVDLGANAGLASAYLSARHRPTTLIAVEPLAENLTVLRHNAACAGTRWIIEPCAAAPSPGSLDFHISGYWCTASAVEAVGRYRLTQPHRIEQAMPRPPVTVAADTVDAILARHNIDRVDLMKIDIEGGEFALLADHPAWLRRVDRIVIEIHDKYIDGAPVRAALTAAGLHRYPAPHLDRTAPSGMAVELHVRTT
ncbi:FkbM family methyltransferase [Nocardia sp. BMG51109]|uniref:FkbM family methyltransferase n=1 Tax=Nocardia sp. BMG51109 TaxID=1056816 RepID=UPI0004630E7C|nr:FkbM family methyltransferase [Nocardia sp. BMG51109]